ncbi:MAG TPA: hypothetical protein VF848_06760 [Steroidobacteraceae bacterium]
MSTVLLPLNAWGNFYVIVGSAAAGLTGLTFVVIALAAELPVAQPVRYSGLRTYMTPTIVHFGSVLWIAALLNVPGHTPVSVAVCMASSGLVGMLYSLTTAHRMHRGRVDYRPFLSDWVWNAVMPFGTYLALAVAGAKTYLDPGLALYGIGAAALVLLVIGIHNVWDLALWIIAKPSRPAKQHEGHEGVGSNATSAGERATKD